MKVAEMRATTFWPAVVGIALTLEIPFLDFDASRATALIIPLQSYDLSHFPLSEPRSGVLFDIDGDGAKERVSWPLPGAQVAFLAIDRNGNGAIDNGIELFGSQTLPGTGGGFSALIKYDGPRTTGAIDSSDALFQRLLLWTDNNHNGASEPDELYKAADAFAKLGLGYFLKTQRHSSGSEFVHQGWSIRRRDFRNRPDDQITPVYELRLATEK